MSYEQETYQQETEQQEGGQNALNLKWVVGLNYKIVNGVHNLSNDAREREQIFYASAHTGVIYDYRNKRQVLLQGHCNKITCTAYNAEEDIIVTADKGPDSMLVVWNAKEGTPRKTIFDPHPNGTESLDISPDGRYILTISKIPKHLQKKPGEPQQTICLWDWKKRAGEGEMGGQNPSLLISCQMDQRFDDYHKYIKFNPDTKHEFCTTGPLRVGFWHWEPTATWFEFYSPGVTQGVGKSAFTQTVFIPENTQAVSGTTLGTIVVWDISLIMDDFSQPEERRNIKNVNLMNKNNNTSNQGQGQGQNAISITILLIQDKYLVVGSSNGSVRFYDDQYRIISWFEDIGITNITSISFAQQMPPQEILDRMKGDDDGGNKKDKNEEFWCPDFIVVDHKAEVRLLNYELFNIINDEKKRGETLLKSIVNDIMFIAVRPESTELAFCTHPRTIYRWDYHEKNEIIEPFYVFKKENCEGGLSCIKFSPCGKYLVVGTKDAIIYICVYQWDDEQKKEVAEFIKWDEKIRQYGIHDNIENQLKIVDIVFSSDSKWFATYDESHSVALFKYGVDETLEEKAVLWFLLARIQSHTLPITSLSFGQYINEKGVMHHRLFSVGQDMMLIEYDIKNTTKETSLLIRNKGSVKQVEQEYVPTASIWYPTNVQHEREEILLTANEEFHLKLWDVQDPNEFICKRTCLGPTYGGPITKLLVINPENAQSEFEDQYLAYQTEEKIVGIIKLPIDGNPDKTMGLIAHPGTIASIAVSGDGKRFFTCGGEDKTINIWEIYKGAISDNFVKYEEGDENDPFMNLLEGGKKGQTYQDMQFFFYYAQIKSQDEDTTEHRNLTGKVPLNQIPYLMRAMGHYPTEQEIQNMVDEIKYSRISEQKPMVEFLDQQDFVKLFLNHRPVYGIGQKQIQEAFFELTKPANKLNEREYQQVISETFSKQVGTANPKSVQDIVDSLYKPAQTLEKDQFIKYLQEGGEKMALEGGKDSINNFLNILLGAKPGENAFEQMPKKLTLEYIMKDLFGFEQSAPQQAQGNMNQF